MISDHAIDIVNTAFEMALEYSRNKKDDNISPFVLYRNVDRLIKKQNKINVVEVTNYVWDRGE